MFIQPPRSGASARKIDMVEILYCTEMSNYIQIRATAKNMRHIKKKLQIKVIWNWILYKKVCERICLFPLHPPWSQGARETDMVEILYWTEMVNYIQIRLQCFQNYVPHQEKLQIKVVRNYNTEELVNKTETR